MIGDFDEYEKLTNLIWRDQSTMTEDCNGFEIYSTINKNNDTYLTIIKNGMGDPKNGGLNHNQKVCRISILNPIYIQYDELLTKKEKESFMNIVSEKWDEILEDNYDFYHNYLSNKKYKKLNINCPDYSKLETLD